eukprot:5985412-Prymnesium_polylepis.1
MLVPMVCMYWRRSAAWTPLPTGAVWRVAWGDGSAVLLFVTSCRSTHKRPWLLGGAGRAPPSSARLAHGDEPHAREAQLERLAALGRRLVHALQEVGARANLDDARPQRREIAPVGRRHRTQRVRVREELGRAAGLEHAQRHVRALLR